MAIQQLQIDAGILPGQDKRSLREIQEEEESRKTEEDFLKWWSAEEERIKLDSLQSLELSKRVKQPRSSKKPRPSKDRQPGRRYPPKPDLSPVVLSSTSSTL